MARDMEKAVDQPTLVEPEPTIQPPQRWLKEEVEEIAKEECQELSSKAKKKVMAELERAILQGEDPCRANIPESLTESFVSVACGWLISGRFLDVASIDGKTLFHDKA